MPQVCRLAKMAGCADLLPNILEVVRRSFAKLAPAAVAELLAWLPLDSAASLLQADVSSRCHAGTHAHDDAVVDCHPWTGQCCTFYSNQLAQL